MCETAHPLESDGLDLQLKKNLRNKQGRRFWTFTLGIWKVLHMQQARLAKPMPTS